MGSVIQIQKSNAIAIGKTSLNVNNVKSTKLNQQAIKLVNQTIGAHNPEQATASTTTGKYIHAYIYIFENRQSFFVNFVNSIENV